MRPTHVPDTTFVIYFLRILHYPTLFLNPLPPFIPPDPQPSRDPCSEPLCVLAFRSGAYIIALSLVLRPFQPVCRGLRGKEGPRCRGQACLDETGERNEPKLMTRTSRGGAAKALLDDRDNEESNQIVVAVKLRLCLAIVLTIALSDS